MKEIKLPRAVIAQKERIDALVKETDANAHTEPTENPEDVDTTVDVVDTKSEHTPEAPKQDTPEAPARSPDYWEHRFKTVEGMFTAFKTKAANDLDSYRTEISALKQKLTDTVAQVPKEYDLRKYMSEEDINSYGEGMLKTILKTASQIADEQVSERLNTAIEEKVVPMQRQLQDNEAAIQQDRESLFWGAIEDSVPNWKAVNGDPTFHKWLAEEEGLSGLTRQELLSGYQRSLSASKVINLFNVFLKTRTSQKDTVQQRLEKKVVPETSAASGNIVPDDGIEYISKAVVKQFYSDKAVGKYRSRPEEAAKMEKKINAAYMKGRVTD